MIHAVLRCLALTCALMTGWSEDMPTAPRPADQPDAPSATSRLPTASATNRRTAPPAARPGETDGQAAAPALPTAAGQAGQAAAEEPPPPAPQVVWQEAIVPPAIPVPDASAWLDRGVRLVRLGANLVERRPLARPIDRDYRLAPHDLVRVMTWGGLAQNVAVPLDAAGNLALPGVGAVPLGGLTVAEGQTRVVELLRIQFREGGAILAVERASGSGVTVTGDVPTPGYLALPPGGTVLEALGAAGGVLPTGTLRRILVRRPGAAEEAVDLYRIVLDGDGGLVAPLPPGTTVHVPPAGPQVQVFGAVRRPSLVELKPGDALELAIGLAGGIAAEADGETVRLARETKDGQLVVGVRLSDLAKVAGGDGDRLLVAQRRDVASGTAAVRVEGLVRLPGVHAWKQGLTVAAAIAAAGGTLPGADPTRAVVERLLATPRLIDLGGGVTVPAYRDLLAVADTSMALQPLDVLTVPPAPAMIAQAARVQVEGAVVKPGILPFTPSMTVRDALHLCGGPLADAQVEDADLVRVVVREDGTRDVVREPIDLRPLLKGQPGPELRNQDTLVVRTRSDMRVRVTITGELRNTGSFVLPRGVTLTRALAIAGGLTDDAFPAGARIYRASEAAEQQRYLQDLADRLERALIVNREQFGTATSLLGRQSLQTTIANQEAELARMRKATATGRLAGVDLATALAGHAEADLVLVNGDAIEIPIRPGTIRVMGEVMVPSSLRYEPGLRAPDVVRRAGGPTSQADTDRMFVVRADGSVVASAGFTGTAWDARSRTWVRTSISKLELAEGDTVLVPADLIYRRDGIEVAKDISQILFNVATAAGTIGLVWNLNN